MLRSMLKVLLVLLLAAQAMAQNKRVSDVGKDKPGVESLYATFHDDNLWRTECLTFSEFLLLKKHEIDLTSDQSARLRKLNKEFAKLQMFMGIPVKEADELRKQNKDVFKELESRRNLNEKKKIDFKKKIIQEARDVLTARQLTLAKQALFEELTKYQGLAAAISVKPFSIQVSATEEQLKSFKLLEEKAAQSLRALMLEAFTNADRKCFELLNRVQQKKVKHELGFEFKPRKFETLFPLNPFEYLRDNEKMLLEGFQFASLVPGDAKLPDSLVFNPEIVEFGMVKSFIVQQKAALGITEQQLKKMDEIEPRWRKRLDELLHSDEFKVLLDEEPELPDEELERIGIKYQNRETEIGWEMDQESLKILRPDQLTKAKSILFKQCIARHHLSRVLLEKPFVVDLEFTDVRKKKLIELNRQSIQSFVAVLFSVREELNEDVFELLNPEQQALVRSWRLTHQKEMQKKKQKERRPSDAQR